MGLFTSAHNETVNVVTHLLPLVFHVAWMVQFDWAQADPVHWVLFQFEVLMAACMLFSVVYHLFFSACPTRSGYMFLLRLDLVGVVFAMMGSLFILIWLPLGCAPALEKFTIVALPSTISLALVLRAEHAKHRGFGFLLMIVCLAVALVNRGFSVLGNSAATLTWAVGNVCMFVGGALNVARVPERWWPDGRLDLLGNSHQIMHVLTAAASLCCLLAGLEDVAAVRDHPSLHACLLSQFPFQPQTTPTDPRTAELLGDL